MAKILLVEDDNNLREIYEARLQAEGYTIVAASDGEQALVVAKNERPDLVISDVMMPKISGFEMLDILRNTDGLKDVKVIMLTALGQSEDKTRADQLGANKYLVKSQVTLEDIIKTAHQLLDDTPAPIPAMPTAAPAPVASTADPVTVAPMATPVVTDPAPAAPASADPNPVTPTAPVIPAADPATATLPDPDSVNPLKDADPTNDPLSLAEESAAMQAKLDDFEAQPIATPAEPVEPEVPAPAATPPAVDPTPPVEAPVAAIPETPAPALEPVTAAAPLPALAPTPTVAPVAADSANANDATLASAVDSLSTASQKPSDVTAVETPPAAPTAPAAAPATETEATVTPVQVHDSLTIGGQKVIKPLGDLGEKKDINQLLAEELAKSNPAAPMPQTPPAPAPAAPPTQPSSSDPNSVAL